MSAKQPDWPVGRKADRLRRRSLVDIALIRIAIRAIFRQILLVVANILLVLLDVLLLCSGIRAMGIGATGEQTGKSYCEHTSTNDWLDRHGFLS